MQTNIDIKIDTDQETYIASNHNACVYIDLYFIRGIVTSLFIDLYSKRQSTFFPMLERNTSIIFA